MEAAVTVHDIQNSTVISSVTHTHTLTHTYECALTHTHTHTHTLSFNMCPQAHVALVISPRTCERHSRQNEKTHVSFFHHVPLFQPISTICFFCLLVTCDNTWVVSQQVLHIQSHVQIGDSYELLLQEAIMSKLYTCTGASAVESVTLRSSMTSLHLDFLDFP